MGVYVVCVGYFVAGYPGAAVGMLAMATPALLILLLLRLLGNRVDDPRIKNAVRYVIVGGSSLSAFTLFKMGQSALAVWWCVAIAIVAAALLLRTRLSTIWIVVGAGAVGVMVK
jgi:chromate transporter